MAGNGTTAFGTIGKAVGVSVLAIGGLIGVAAGLFTGLDALANKTATYALGVEKTSNLTHMQTSLIQTLTQAGNVLGVSQDTLNTRLAFFEKNLEAGVPTLKKYGLSLSDLHVTTTNSQEAFLQLADTIKSGTFVNQEAGIMTAFFGRSWQDMLPIMRQGRDGIAALNTEFANFGLILTDGQLQINSTAKLLQDKLHLELQGLEGQVGNALIPAFMDLWDVLGKVVNPAGKFASTAEAIANALKQAVFWVVGFIEELTGATVQISDFTDMTASAIGKLALAAPTVDTTAGSVQTLSQRVSDLQDNIQSLTDAQSAFDAGMQASTDTIRAQTTAFDDGMQAQTDAIKAQQTAYDALTQSQLASLDAQKATIDLAFQQWNQQNALSDANAKLTADQRRLVIDSQKAGFDPTSEKQQIVADQNAILRQQATIQVDAAKTAIDLQKTTLAQAKQLQDNAFKDDIARLDALKKTKDNAFKDDIARLDATKKATDAAYKDQIKTLQDQVKEAQKADAALAASGTTTAAALTASSNATALTDQANTAASLLAQQDSQRAQQHGFVATRDIAAGSFADAANAGIKAAAAVRVQVGYLRDWVWQVWQALQAVIGAFQFLGTLVGQVFGILKALNETAGNAGSAAASKGSPVGKGSVIGDALNSLLGDLLNEPVNVLGDMWHRITGRETGGPVFQDSPYLVGEKGPELFVPSRSGVIVPQNALASQGHQASGGGGDSAETNALLRQLVALFSTTGSNGQFMTVMRALMQQMNSQAARGVRGAGYWAQ